jgi:REP element-mobilizing transposase RayT
MPYWLVTSSFYGQWLPGDDRGSVTSVLERRPGDPATRARLEHARPGDEYEEAMPGLRLAAAEQLKCAPICVDLTKAEALFEQFQETAEKRGWILHAVSIMFNHIHLVVETPPAVGKKQLLQSFKSYGSRRLNEIFGRQPSDTWWSDGGSCRIIRYLAASIFYVCHRQPNPLLIWSRERGRIPPGESHPDNA